MPIEDVNGYEVYKRLGPRRVYNKISPLNKNKGVSCCCSVMISLWLQSRAPCNNGAVVIDHKVVVKDGKIML